MIDPSDGSIEAFVEGRAPSAAEVVVVGGGFAGLSAAYHLIEAQPGLDVVLIEAGEVGSGASGRNTGMLGPGVGGTITQLRRRLGDEGAAEVFGASERAVRRVLGLIGREAIGCDLEVTGQLKVAMGARHAASLARQARDFEALGFEVPWLDAAQTRARIATKAYCGALFYPEAAMLDPLKLCRGLRRVLIERGVRVVERCPVEAVVPGDPVVVRLGSGELRAKRAVMAANAYSARLGHLAGKVVPLHTHVILTAPLTRWQLSDLAWSGREAIIDARNFFNYYRLTPDDRVMFGGGQALYRPARGDRRAGALKVADPGIWRGLARELGSLLPPLAGLEVARCWSGAMGFTLDGFPVVGAAPEAPGIVHASGWCGHGVAMAFEGGAIAAEAAMGRGRPRSLPWRGAGSTPTLPPDPLRHMGLSTYLKALAWVDARWR